MLKKLAMISLVVAFLFGAAGPVKAASPMSTLYVVHGINGVDLGLGSSLPVDVLLKELAAR